MSLNIQVTTQDDKTVTANLTQEQIALFGGNADATYALKGTKQDNGSVLMTDLVISGKDGSNATSTPLTNQVRASLNDGTLSFDDEQTNALIANRSMADKASINYQKKIEENAKVKDAPGTTPDGRGAADGGRVLADGTTPPPAGGDKTFMESAGEFANDNKMALGGGLMVGLLAAAMGGGIMGLILGLLAAVLIGGMMGMGKSGPDAAGGPKRDEPKKAMGKERTKGEENAIDVGEGEKVAVTRKKGEQTEYLNGQDKDTGEMKYGATPEDITLRTINDKGEAVGLIRGKVNEGTGKFDVKETAGALGDGRMSPAATGSSTSASIGSDGTIDLAAKDMADAQQKGAVAAAAYKKDALLTMQKGTGDSITAEMKDSKGNPVTLKGTLISDGNEAVFTKAELSGTKGKDGKPMEIDLPAKELQKVAVKDGTVTVMQGDVDKLAAGVGEKKEQLKSAVAMAMQAGAMVTGSTVMGVGTAPEREAAVAAAPAVDKAAVTSPAPTNENKEIDFDKMKENLGKLGTGMGKVAEQVYESTKDALTLGLLKDGKDAGASGAGVASQQTGRGDTTTEKDSGRG